MSKLLFGMPARLRCNSLPDMTAAGDAGRDDSLVRLLTPGKLRASVARASRASRSAAGSVRLRRTVAM